MPELEQYEPISTYDEVDGPVMDPARDGGWVKHEDALTALQQQRKQVIAEVEEALKQEAIELRAGAMVFRQQATEADERGSSQEAWGAECTAEARENAAERFDRALATLTKGGTDA